MGRFLKENWVWIVLPMVLAIAVLVFLIFFFEGDDVAPFIYHVGVSSAETLAQSSPTV